ncbi:MAG: class I SAM-dependent methyltransferase [Promethearchaeota archaeon]
MTTRKTLEIDKDLIRENFNKYTRKAFQMLPKLHKPRILDIGCGSGVPTLELARLSNGQIIGLDVNQSALDNLNTKIEKLRLTDRVKPVKGSMFELKFQDESFDIVWAEGSISVIGFKRGLKEWRRFLKPNGFLVVHDEQKNMTKKLEEISNCGYKLIGHFKLSEAIWWVDYYEPLEKLINDTRIKCANEPNGLLEFANEEREINMIKKNPALFRSVFFVMQKRT